MKHCIQNINLSKSIEIVQVASKRKFITKSENSPRNYEHET